MRKALLAIIFALVLLPVAIAAMQDSPAPTIEITGVNPTELPVITVTTTVLDSLGQPVDGLTTASFQVVGELADQAQIVSVRRIEDENLPVAVVLVIDVSSSMAGRPFADAQESAKIFVNAMDDNTSIAIVTFGNNVQVIQDYTTDKSVLLTAIDNLGYGGQTALYEGALAGVQKAAQAPSPRRFMILLSDGAQYETGKLPSASREAAATEALAQGVPVYTIGLGFGADRSYLDQIASLTNARFYESPSSNQLQQIYTNLAQLLRSQYEVVLNIDLPANGTFYDLGLQVTTQQGTVSASSSLRTPIPVPMVQAPILDGPVSELTEARASVLTDDGVASVEIKLDGVSQSMLTEEPYSFMIDPMVITPGAHTLEYIATDTNGDSGSATLEFEVVSLESTITLLPELPTEEITQALNFGLQITGQTLPDTVSYTLDRGEAMTLVPPVYGFTIDPLALPPGEHTYAFTVVNQAGITTTIERTVTIADIPPRFVVTGLQDGDTLTESTEVLVDILTSQAEVTSLEFALNGEVISTGDRAPNSLILEAANLPPGASTLSITVNNAAEQSATTDINFQVAALPPEISISSIELGETLEENREIEVSAVTQPENDVNSVVFLLDNVEVSSADAAPATFTLDVSAIEPGPHILSVTASNESGESATSDIAFVVGEGPSLTLTAMVTPSDTPTFTPTVTLTPTLTFTPAPTLTIDRTATVVAENAALLITADAQATADAVIAFATSTVEAEIAATGTADTENLATTQAQGTIDAQAAIDAQATLSADEQATLDAQAAIDTQAAQATTDAEETEEAIVRVTANVEATAVVQTVQAVLTATQIIADQQATLDIQATTDAQATADSQATVDAEAMAAMVATANAPLTATAEAQEIANMQATADAEASTTADAQSTLDAQAALDAQGTLDAQAALDAQSTLDAQATLDTQGTATQSAADAQATLSAQEALNADATASAEAQEAADAQSTLDAQATLDAEATANAQATLDAQSTLDAQATLDAEATANAQATLDAQSTLDAQATLDAEATADAQATIDAQAALAAETEVVTEEATQVEPTEAGTAIAQAATTEASATATIDEIDRTPVSTVTPIGTLIPQQAETAPASNNALPILVIVIIGIVILLIVFLVLNRARRRDRR